MIKKALFKYKEVKMTKFTVFAIRCALILLLCAITLFFALWVPTLHEEICELLHAQAEKLYMLHNLVFPLASIISLSPFIKGSPSAQPNAPNISHIALPFLRGWMCEWETASFGRV
jgi:choline-glycine betaine transporter